MYIPRFYENLSDYLKPGKVLVIYGPRQVGKTTLLRKFLATTKLRYRMDTGDDIRVQEVLGSQNLARIKEYIEDYELLVIDEAQKIRGVGIGLKLIVDNFPHIRVTATGSSSFELAGQIGEPLTGRKGTVTLYPVSYLELRALHNSYELKTLLEKHVIYGTYPAVLTATTKEGKKEVLNELTGSYLLKDVLELEKVKGSKTLFDLLRLLAFQIGNEVSLSELGKQLGIDYKTVARYLDLLEKAFVIYNVRGFSGNLRKEITKKSKYYFYDTGVRNAIISNYNEFALRDDVGQLFENFIFMERLKKRAYKNIYGNVYFWRTWEGHEIDVIEEREGTLYGYELKWKQKRSVPKLWQKTYPEAKFEVINKDNYLDFIA